MKRTWLPVIMAVALTVTIGSTTLALDADQETQTVALESLLEEIDSVVDAVGDSDDPELTALKERTKAQIRDALAVGEVEEEQRVRVLARVREFLQTVERTMGQEQLRNALRVMSQMTDETGLDPGEICEQLQERIETGASLHDAAEAVRELARTQATLRQQESVQQAEQVQEQDRSQQALQQGEQAQEQDRSQQALQQGEQVQEQERAQQSYGEANGSGETGKVGSGGQDSGQSGGQGCAGASK